LNDVQNPVTAADMFIGTTNEFVAIYEVPGNGTSPRQLGESETATYYVQTMLFAEKNKTEFTARYKVRAYALLEDGTYVYSDVHDYSVYDISKEIYQNVLMNNLEGHEYLYNSILSIVDKTMEKIDFDIDRNITN